MTNFTTARDYYCSGCMYSLTQPPLKKHSSSPAKPTDTYPILEPQNPSIDASEVHKFRRSADFEAPELWKGRSGSQQGKPGNVSQFQPVVDLLPRSCCCCCCCCCGCCRWIIPILVWNLQIFEERSPAFFSSSFRFLEVSASLQSRLEKPNAWKRLGKFNLVSSRLKNR